MKLTDLIKELTELLDYHGDLEVYLQGTGDEPTTATDSFFIVAEEYEDGPAINIRTWPY